eukprot:TRINITY_DN4524_c0_g4_i1.p2 TRINITY_DN4524_c0_g4~~TRINITY_DN4524_c0_g4_i1.p2  ORF type:complete len:109 (+),score=0.18 TRINITY_DN4524_c0_g4_i1:94-420(+)
MFEAPKFRPPQRTFITCPGDGAPSPQLDGLGAHGVDGVTALKTILVRRLLTPTLMPITGRSVGLGSDKAILRVNYTPSDCSPPLYPTPPPSRAPSPPTTTLDTAQQTP